MSVDIDYAEAKRNRERVARLQKREEAEGKKGPGTGDVEARNQLFDKHYREEGPKLLRMLQRQHGNQRAEDILQEAYTNALMMYNPETVEDFGNWMFIVIKNLGTKETSDDGNHVSADLIDLPSPSAPADLTLECMEYIKMMKDKGTIAGKVLELHLVCGMTAGEVAKLLPVSEDNVWKIVQRFREEMTCSQ
jgi:DNA-directed RNA polymerase specialized sigma24 family protein